MSHYTLQWLHQEREYIVHYGHNDDLGFYLIVPEPSSGSATPATFVSTKLTNINNQEFLSVLTSMNAPQDHCAAVEKGEPF